MYYFISNYTRKGRDNIWTEKLDRYSRTPGICGNRKYWNEEYYHSCMYPFHWLVLTKGSCLSESAYYGESDLGNDSFTIKAGEFRSPSIMFHNHLSLRVHVGRRERNTRSDGLYWRDSNICFGFALSRL